MSIVTKLSAPVWSSGSPFAEWHVDELRFTRNCYAFACDAKAPDISDFPIGDYNILIPDPGETTGNPYSESSLSLADKRLRTKGVIDSMHDALMSDGFIALPYDNQNDIAPMKTHYLVAAYVDLDLGDYHFYRRHEESGVWHHKPGWYLSVTDRDELNRQIIDPRKAKHEFCTEFAGFFLAPNAGIRLPIQIESAPIEAGKAVARGTYSHRGNSLTTLTS